MTEFESLTIGTTSPRRDDEGPEPGQEISGWADSISKILKSGKPKNKKELILSRARKDYEVSKSIQQPKQKQKPQDTLEIVRIAKFEEDTPDPDDVDETKITADPLPKKVEDNILSLKVQRKLELKQKKLERAWENLARMTTEKTEPQFERDLLKIATKGVVQLFNAISMQQKTVRTKLRTSKQSEFTKDKVLSQTKELFDSAMTKSKHLEKASLTGDVKIKEESDDEGHSKSRKRKSNDNRKDGKKKPAWTALQDNYMLDAKLKDWDQDSDDDDSE